MLILVTQALLSKGYSLNINSYSDTSSTRFPISGEIARSRSLLMPRSQP